MYDFKKLIAWERAQAVAVSVYEQTTGVPSIEQFGLTQQIRRAAVSTSGNIAEGCRRESQRDFARFLKIALGSALELESHWLISRKLRFASDKGFVIVDASLSEAKKTLYALYLKVSGLRS